MRLSRLLILSGVFLFNNVKSQDVYNGISINDPIPESRLSLQSTNKKDYTLAQIKTTKGLLVMFSCNTCPYVIKSQARTKEMIALAKKLGIGMAIINSNETQRGDADAFSAMEAYARAQKYTVPYLLDKGDLAKAFGAKRTPEVFLFNGTGKLVYKGAMEDNPSDPGASKHLFLKEAMENLVKGKEINPAVTKSIGCSIKL